VKRTEQAVRDYIAQHQEELKQRVVNIFIGEIANAVFLAENNQTTLTTYSQEVRDDVEDIVKEVLDFDEDPTASA
jgi:predicted Zn-dependent protease with MMP-like domain|tara:strand:- start:937 stop:1161 length:225 start_codon:yes stop_codon:yes gene_type:complete